MSFSVFVLFSLVICANTQAPRIVSENGHLILYSAEHKNISLRTVGQGAVHINGLDVTKYSKASNEALQSIEKYQTNFENTYAKLSRLERLVDDGVLNRILKPDNTSTSYLSVSDPVVRNIRRLNRRINNLQKSIRLLSLLLSTDECLSNPCKNGGTCQDLFNGFMCLCPPEWEGETCSKDVNECARFAGTDLGCQNGATCNNRLGSYECLCPHGWFGIHCTRRSTDCKSGSNAELCGHGTCVTQYNDVGYKCICDQGWTTDGRTPACNTDINECEMNARPCSVNPLVPCINLPGSFHCGNCPAGYSGNGYYCSDIDECSTSNGGCSVNPKVQCINTLGSRICASCPPGYVGDGVVCSYQGVCSVNNGGCHHLATCRSNPRISQSFVECVCPPGYRGSGIGPNGCIQTVQAIPSVCHPNPCRNGICRASGNGSDYTCDCFRRYTGRNCDTFRDMCASNPCFNGGTCRSLFGMSFRCICPSTHTGFTCQTERQACGGRLTGETGSLVFPSVSYQLYGNLMSCAWIIETNSSKVLNITFSKFDIEDSEGCAYDWIEIHDGENTMAPSLGRFCGNTLPKGGTIITTHDVVYLWFRSDHSVRSDGFNLTWTSIVPFCGEEEKQVTSHGTVKSPGSPGNYPNNRDCYWKLIAPPGKRLLFHFFTLMIGDNPDCDNDYLEFLSGQSSFAKFCNSSHPSPIFSPASEVSIHFHSDSSDNYPGFQITYSVAEGMPGCGGTYTRLQDEIRSPSFTGSYPNDVQCEYKIQLPPKSYIKLTFLTFDIEASPQCIFDYVAIHSGDTADGPLLGRYCGSQLPPPYFTQNNNLFIVFKTDWHTNKGGWTLKYEIVCGGKFVESEGVLQSPDYPNVHPEAQQCIYEIEQPLGTKIQLRIADLDLENSFPDCQYDFLEVRDGHNENAALLGKYCGNKFPSLIISSYNYLWIKYQVDASNNGRGFKANYSTVNTGCGGILKEYSGSFKSPNYPDLYPEDTGCEWILSAPPGHVINIVWLQFQLEKTFECTYDYVQIFDNNTETGRSSSVGKFCGSVRPKPLTSTSNLVTVVFQSDSTHHMTGFLATYAFLPMSETCGGNYFTDAGLILSPNYPENYPLNIECTWTIEVKPGHQILLNVTDFQLEKYGVCRYDWLEIRNGGSASSPLLGKYCATTIPKLIPSHANKLFIYFHSDMTKAEKGFRITWEATATGCGGTLTGPSGSIISPNYPEPYNVNAECIWKISISLGSVIQIVFSDLDLEEHGRCRLDYVEILDGPTLNSKSLGRFCTTHPSYIQSSTNNLVVRFRSDLSRNGRGFQLQYSTMCNNTVKGFRGVIESPNFPNSYPSSMNCNWDIVVAQKNRINITFSHFDLEKNILPADEMNTSNACVFDYVEILSMPPFEEYEEPPPFEKFGIYCATDIPPLITLNSSHAQIRFVSDNLLYGNGFRLEWQLDGCGDILTKPNGTISSPNYPNPYPTLVECNWKIQVDFGYQIEITFHTLMLEKSHDCYLDYVKLYNGEDETYPEIASICHQEKLTTLKSTGNVMFIKFHADQSVQGMGFYANYTSLPTKCGGKFVGNKANIMSPNYPNNYEINDTCGYEIEVTEGHRIGLHFEDFDLYSLENYNCTTNNDSYVKVYDGPSIDFPVLAKFCAKDGTNKTVTSTTNKMFVEMVTSTSLAAKGFLAHYEMSCGARIETESSGTIRMDPHYLNYETYNCSWTIISKDPSKHVSLTITHLDTMNSYCDSDSESLKVFNGESPDAPLLGTYCGTKIPPTLTSSGSALHVDIEYGSVMLATYSVFDSHCGGTLTSIDGFFASPGYPNKYPVDTECEWTIQIPEGNHVSLSFIDFELLQSDYCNNDYLEIRQDNGTGKLLGTFCGTNLPMNITNVGSLWIFLKTSRLEGDISSLTAKGFQAEYLFKHENELTGKSGRIVSPLYSFGYALTGEYSWKISVDFSKRILITFKEVNLEGFGDICYASIMVHDGQDDRSPPLKEICGTTLPDPIKTTTNMAFVKYSGYGNARSISKFILEWVEVNVVAPSPIRAPNVTGCGTPEPVNINGLKNVTKISSPGYPDGYAPGLTCEWIFTTIPMNRLKIYFIDMDLQLQYGDVCYSDYVEVFEKKLDSDWTSVIKTCRENITRQGYIFTTNMMKVVFKSDNFINATGFTAVVRENCGGYLTEPTGYIILDNSTRDSYGRFENCEWNITVGAGKTIEIEIMNINILTDEESGCKNYITMWNGKFSDSPMLGDGKYCGTHPPEKMQTTGNNARVKFSGQTAVSNFKIRYREISYQCGGEIQLNQYENTTQFSSPNYPQIPPPHIECVWRITAPPGEIIRIDFPERFDVGTANKKCKEEYVEIRDGGTTYSPLIGQYCSQKPNTQFSTDNMMFVKFFTNLNDPNNGFKAKLTLSNCGGTIHSTSGQLQSPFYNTPSKYPVGANCTWHLMAPIDHSVQLSFKKIDLPDSFNCSSDRIWIYEANKVNASVNSLGTFCGKAQPPDLVSAGNEVQVNFQTDTERKEFKGFSLQFNSSLDECGGSVEGSQGFIQSPGYPVPHKSRRICNWFVKVPPGRRITFTVLDYDILPQLSKSWLAGVSIYNSDKFLGFIKKLSPGDTTVESSENHALVYYWSMGNAGRGFKLKYSSSELTRCVGNLNEDSGDLTQPNIKYPYYCTYTRDNHTPGTTLSMTISTVVKAPTSVCKNYFLLISVQSDDISEPLANIDCIPTTAIIRSTFSKLSVKMQQYNMRNQVNYTISYKTYPCGGKISGESGQVTSPGYPQKSNTTLECGWLIQVPAEQTILLSFDDLDLGDNCEKAYLDIYNGFSSRSPKIDRLCQKNKPKVIQSESNKLWIEYKYDRDSNAKGFSLRYEPSIHGCGGVFHDPSRIIQSPAFPNDYPNNAECLWELRSNPGYSIGLIFTTRFQIEESEGCLNDFVEVWNWENDEWKSFGKKCGRDFPTSLNSTSNKLKILFRSNDRISGKGFRARWEWNCGGAFTADNTERFIVSPGYPQPYPQLMKCMYNISAPFGNYVNIKFYQFELEGSGSNCRYDNFTVSNMYIRSPNFRHYSMQVFCGKKLPPDMRMNRNIYILFQTDQWMQKSGFKLSYQLDDCGGNITSPTVVKKSFVKNLASRSNVYQGHLICLWHITAPPNKQIVIRFQEFSMVYRTYCYFDNVAIYEGISQSRANLIANLCGDLNHILPVIRTENNSAVMTLRTDTTMAHGSITAEIYFADGPAVGCGGNINLEGTKTLTAPDLTDMDCSWSIQTSQEQTIKVHFDELNLPLTCGFTNHTRHNCTCAHLQIRDGRSDRGEIIETLCGTSNSQREITSSGNSLGVRLFTRGAVRKAFQITLTAVPSICGSAYLNATTEVQTLTSPGYPNKYPSDVKCAWAISSNTSFVIHFVDFDLNTQQVCNDKLVITEESLGRRYFYHAGEKTIAGYKSKTTNFARLYGLPLHNEYCGSDSKPFDYYTDSFGSYVVNLKFSSAALATNHGKGFKLEYYVPGCKQNYTSLHGRVTINIQAECGHLITVPNNYTISLFFEQVRIHGTTDCEQAGLEIHDGMDQSAKTISKICDYMLPNPVFSTGNSLWIRSWDRSNRSGYYNYNNIKAAYTSSDQGRGCGGKLYDYRGIFTSPLYPMGYKASTPCSWDIQVPTGMRAALKFSVFDIQGDCEFNYVKVTTYETDNGNEHTFCKNDNPAELYSNYRILVTYQSSVNNGGSGWSAVFEAVHN